MIFQGLFQILDLYFNEIYLFYNNIDKYFKQHLLYQLEEDYEEDHIQEILKHAIKILRKEFLTLGFVEDDIEIVYLNQIGEIKHTSLHMIDSIEDLYEIIIPIIYEFFLEKIIDYLANNTASTNVMLKLRTEKILPISFIVELRNLKRLFELNPKKTKNLNKYIQIRDEIVKKLRHNKTKIESVRDLSDARDKLQLFYMIYQIINFFSIQDLFDYSEIKDYILNNMEEWLDTIPLVSLKNPDLYYCGIYLASELDIPIDTDMVKYFLLTIYDENIDEFEAPLIEATNQVYYFFKSAWLVDLELSESQIKELLKGDSEFYSITHLKSLETSELVLILKILKILGVYHHLDSRKINNIIEEIDHRITDKGIIQYRDGFLSSEATYYVLFSYYMRNSLGQLKDYDFLDRIVSRIYRNLEILAISEETNYDLVSELFYSVETLRLLNCIDRKHVTMHLAKYLFPEQVIERLHSVESLISDTARFRHIRVDQINGEKVCL